MIGAHHLFKHEVRTRKQLVPPRGTKVTAPLHQEMNALAVFGGDDRLHWWAIFAIEHTVAGPYYGCTWHFVLAVGGDDDRSSAILAQHVDCHIEVRNEPRRCR